MGKKIFASYKYADSLVERLPEVSIFDTITVRNYVDKFEELLEGEDDVYKGESDGEDLSDLSEDTIAQKLRDRIYDSSVTIVFVSKGMKDSYKTEKNQWIPWEISYSLKEVTRGEKTSQTNAILAVVLPDENGSYDYYIEHNASCNSNTLKTNWMFPIMGKNMFNRSEPDTYECNGATVHRSYSSYIYSVKWEEFKKDYKNYIDTSVTLFEDKDSYDIKKELEG